MARYGKMHSSYNRLKAKALSERGKRMAAARWKIDRARRDAEMPERLRELAEIELMNLPRKEGDIIGCFQWSDNRTGKVRRWVIRIGDRADRYVMESMDGRKSNSHGWSHLLTKLRKHLLAC